VGEAHPGETLRAMIRTGEIAAAVEAAINENYLQDPVGASTSSAISSSAWRRATE